MNKNSFSKKEQMIEVQFDECREDRTLFSKHFQAVTSSSYSTEDKK